MTTTAPRVGPPVDGTVEAPEPAGVLARAWARPLGWHVLLLTLVLLAFIPLARPGVATIDEGAYGLQARLVADGSWSYPQRLAQFDPDGRYFPITRSAQVGDRWFVYAKHPAVPATLAFSFRVIGESATLALLPIAAAIAAAVAAWLLAAELRPSLARTAFWLVAASPLVFNAYVIWAHAPATALAGLAFVAMQRIVRSGPSTARLAGLSAALAAGVLIRSEGVLVAGAVLLVLAVCLWRTGGPRRAALAAVPGATVVATLWLERRVVAHILGGPPFQDLAIRGTGHGSELVRQRIEGVWMGVLRGGGPQPFERQQLLLPVALGLVTVVVLLCRRQGRVYAELALAGLAAVYLVEWAAWPTGVITGLAPAAPLLVVGVALAFGGLRRDGFGPMAAATALLGAAIVATQYADGGGYSWGGRFFSPILVPVAVLAAVGLHRLVEDRPADARHAVVGTLAILTAVMLLIPVAVLGRTRAQVETIYDDVAASASAANVTTSEHLPRLMWRQDLDWLVAPGDEVGDLLESMRRDGVEQVTAVVPATLEIDDLGHWSSVTDRGQLDQTGLRVLVLRR